MPIKFKTSKLPYIDVMIEGKNYPLVLDLGSRLELNMHADILEKLHTYPCSVEKWKNLMGAEFESQTYFLSKIEIGSLTFKKVFVASFPKEKEEKNFIFKNTNRKNSSFETVGCLGRGLLKKVNLLIDIKNSRVIFTNSFKKLKNDGYDLITFQKVPFDLIPKGILLKVDTDLGRMKLLLDTGCTWTMLHQFLYPDNIEKKNYHYGFPVLTSIWFRMNGIDFGSQKFYFLGMTKELNDVDRFLGMDFIKKYVMYIDFSKKTLYIQK